MSTFADLLDAHGVKYQSEGRHCRSGWLQFDCPFCNGKLYMGYNLAGRYVNCWRCGGRNLTATVQHLTDLSWPECKRLLDDVGGVRAAVKDRGGGRLRIPKSVGEMQKPHAKYLRSRGFDPAELKRLWHLQGIGLSARLSWRIYIPIIHDGRTVSWTTRSISDDVDARYIAASADEEELSHKDLLYGEDYVRHSVVVHEGPADVWRTGPGAVATLGTGVSDAQVARIAQHLVRVVCFDREREAQRRARRLCDQLEVFPGDTFNVVLKAKDAGAASNTEISQLRRRFLEYA